MNLGSLRPWLSHLLSLDAASFLLPPQPRKPTLLQPLTTGCAGTSTRKMLLCTSPRPAAPPSSGYSLLENVPGPGCMPRILASLAAAHRCGSTVL